MGALPSRKEEAGFLPREALLAQGRVWGPSCQPAAVPATRGTSQDWHEPSGVDLGPGARSGPPGLHAPWLGPFHTRLQQGVTFQGCGRSSGSSQGIPGPPVQEQRPSGLSPELRPGVSLPPSFLQGQLLPQPGLPLPFPCSFSFSPEQRWVTAHSARLLAWGPKFCHSGCKSSESFSSGSRKLRGSGNEIGVRTLKGKVNARTPEPSLSHLTCRDPSCHVQSASSPAAPRPA